MVQDKTLSDNHIKIGASTRVRNVITYTLSLFKENKFNDVTISAIGGAIGSLVNVVEVIKADIAQLHQVNKLSTVSYQTLDPNEKLIQERLYPKMEIILSLEEPKVKTEEYQKPMSDNERKTLSDFISAAKERRTENVDLRGRGGFRSRGRGGFRARGKGYRGGENPRGRNISSRGRGQIRSVNQDRDEGVLQPRERGGFRDFNNNQRGFTQTTRGGFSGLEDSRGYRGNQPRERGVFRGYRGFQQRER
jgi:hypothetical protein